MPKPMCCLGSLNVATNSSERPGGYFVSLPTSAASVVILPFAKVAEPVVCQFWTDHPAGRLLNSVPTVGLRMTSPSAVSDTYVAAPGVPLLKSANVVSMNEGGGVLNVATGDVAVLLGIAASDELTV
jgi:hypothetical protein